MSGKFQWCKFSDVDLEDEFFNSLKSDYSEFPDWFERKTAAGKDALIFNDESGVGAFLYLKEETEIIELTGNILPAVPRLKIGTLSIAGRYRGIRLGEGALGISLWRWQALQLSEIYVTLFDKHVALISLFQRFGFKCVGKKKNGESVYLRNRQSIDYSDAYKSFPFIRPNFNKAGLLPIFDNFHDRLFPYSELKGNSQEIEEEIAGNGITKVYIGTPYITTHYEIGEPAAIYRIFQGAGHKTYKSVITSYCTITNIELVKVGGTCQMTIDEYIQAAGNKTVFTHKELTKIYNNSDNIIMIELVYNGYFGKGNNVTHKDLKDNGLFDAHPYRIDYSKDDFIRILEMGNVNVQNIIIN